MPRKSQSPTISCQFFNWRLFQRQDVFYADGRVGKYNLGKHSLSTRNRETALERLKHLDRIKAVELGLTGADIPPSSSQVSIADGWQMFIDHCSRGPVLGGVSANTLKRYRAVRQKHQAFCDRLSINGWADFDRVSLEKYANQLRKKHAERTIFLELTLLKSVIGWLVDEDHLPAGARLKYPLRKPQGSDTYCYAPTEVNAMITHCRNSDELDWLADALVGLVYTGTRIGELAGLKWTDVNLQRDLLTIADERSSRRKQQSGTARTTKGRRSRTIPIHPQLKRVLSNMEQRPDGFVFHASRGGRILPRNILQQFIDEVIEPLKKQFPTQNGDIGFEHGRLHSFRHFFCSQAILGGASESEVREWLGHADSRMVEHYRHLRDEDAQRKMRQINFLGGSEKNIDEVA